MEQDARPSNPQRICHPRPDGEGVRQPRKKSRGSEPLDTAVALRRGSATRCSFAGDSSNKHLTLLCLLISCRTPPQNPAGVQSPGPHRCSVTPLLCLPTAGSLAAQHVVHREIPAGSLQAVQLLGPRPALLGQTLHVNTVPR